MSVVVAIDAGTTGVRAIAFDHGGAVVDAAYREFTQHFPRPGWVEHDVAEIWDVTQAVLGALTERLAGREVVAIGITNQRETAVVWDAATSRPLHRALVWQDRRTADRCAALEAAGHLPLVRQRTGLVLDPYFTGSKLGWLFSDGGVPTGPTTRAGTVDSWLVWNLTGGAAHVTDTSNASRTLLFDIGRLAWDDELCALFDVPSHVLPEVRPSSARYGVTTADVAGVGAGVPVSGIAGDQQAALFGQACFEPGMTKNTYGTGSFVLMNVGETCPPPIDGLLTTVAWSLPDADAAMRTTYALEGSIFVTGAAVQWLRDGLGIIASAADLEPLAAEVDSTDGVVLVPAFTGLGSPEWDPYARGTIVGITRGTGRAHLARAVIDAMAFQTRDVIDAMTAASGTALRELRIDGGASVMGLLQRLQADQLQVPVTRPVVTETTALGAAYLAGFAEGFWSSLDEVTENWSMEVRTEPTAPAADADAAHAQWRRAVDRSRAWATD